MQQRILIGKSPVERADGDARSLHDFGQRRLGEALLVEYPLGRVEDPVESLLAARLLWRAESRNGHRTNSHPLEAGSPRRGAVGARRGALNKQNAGPTCKRPRRSCPLRTLVAQGAGQPPDRKSTRLNSSHSQISYAVFCLKKKTSTVTTKFPTKVHRRRSFAYT